MFSRTVCADCEEKPCLDLRQPFCKELSSVPISFLDWAVFFEWFNFLQPSYRGFFIKMRFQAAYSKAFWYTFILKWQKTRRHNRHRAFTFFYIQISQKAWILYQTMSIASPILTGVGMPVWKVAKTRAFSKRRSASGFVWNAIIASKDCLYLCSKKAPCGAFLFGIAPRISILADTCR